MSYMSYCRYEGTLHELSRCIDDVEEHINEEAEFSVSKNEIDYFYIMVKKFFDFMNDNELIDYDNFCLNKDRLDEICFAMEKSYDQED